MIQTIHEHNHRPLLPCLMKLLITTMTITFIASSVSWGNDTELFKGTGTAVVIGGDKDSAAKLAQQSAVRKAVSQAMESQLQKGTKEELQYNVKRQELLKGPFPFPMVEEEGPPWN